MIALPLEQLISFGMLVIGLTAWFIRLEGKIKANQARTADLSVQLMQSYATKIELAQQQTQLAVLNSTVASVKEGMDRVERKLDTVTTAGLLERGTHTG